MTMRWRIAAWAALLAGVTFGLPAAAQDDEPAPKKGKAKEEKIVKPVPRSQKKDAPPAKAAPKVEVATRHGDPQNLDEAWRAIDYELNYGTVDEARRLIALAMARPDFTPDNLVD